MKRSFVSALATFSAFFAAMLLTGCATNQTRPAGESTTTTPASQYKPVESIVTGASRTRAKAHTDLGLAYLEAGNVAVALEEGRLAVRDDASYGPAYNLIGLAHLYLQERPQARENFEKALRLAPGDPDINNNFGWFLCQAGETARAMELFGAASKNPLYNFPTRPYTNAGLCAMQAGDLAAAEVNLLRAVNADPANLQAIYNLALLFYRTGNYNEARRYLSDFHTQTDPVAESLWLAVRVERKLGDKTSEAGFAGQLRRRFAGTPEHQALMQGKFD